MQHFDETSEEYEYDNKYLNSLKDLPDCIKSLTLTDTHTYTGIKRLPVIELARFNQLIILDFAKNNLTDISYLTNHPTLTALICSYNNLTQLPIIPNLHTLFCEYNRLNHLPKMTQLKTLICDYNQLDHLPQMPELHTLLCANNHLNFFPDLPKLDFLNCSSNPVSDIFPNNEYSIQIKNNDTLLEPLRILNRFRELYFTLKFKHHFRDWLWEYVRKPKIESMYHPSKLNELLLNCNHLDNLDEILEKW